MEERIVIKSKRNNVKVISIVLVAVGVIVPIIYIFVYSAYAAKLKEDNILWVNSPVTGRRESINIPVSPLSESPAFAIFLSIVIFVSLLCFVLAFCLFMYSKVELTVTNKRVYGTAAWGKRVDLPLDKISAVATSFFHGIAVASSAGSIHFKMIENYKDVHEEISKLLMERQKQEATVTTNTVKDKTQLSNADELKKYKELLDIGAITQEEFDAKKKQLLGL